MIFSCGCVNSKKVSRKLYRLVITFDVTIHKMRRDCKDNFSVHLRRHVLDHSPNDLSSLFGHQGFWLCLAVGQASGGVRRNCPTKNKNLALSYERRFGILPSQQPAANFWRRRDDVDVGVDAAGGEVGAVEVLHNEVPPGIIKRESWNLRIIRSTKNYNE